MEFLKSVDELTQFLKRTDCKIGCLADTGFLYGLAYDDDRLFCLANDIHEVLAEARVPIYTNVISRLELVDLIFRKQVTTGCIKVFNELKSEIENSDTYNALKFVRDKDTEARRKRVSYKIDERQLKSIRTHMSAIHGIDGWRDFCFKYIGSMLETEWTTLEEEFGLNFIEVLEGQPSPLFNSSLFWKDMVQIMSDFGQRGPDAMIINLFAKSKFQLLVTNDRDFEYCFAGSLFSDSSKAVLLLQ